MRSTRSLVPKLVGAWFVTSALVATTKAAHAIPEPTGTLGQKGELVIDQVSGFRMTTDGNLNYYGPIGFSIRSITERDFPTNRTIDNTLHLSTFWFAPSADIFVIDHLSIGGLIEFTTTSATADNTINGTTNSVTLPTTNTFTIEPRVGWMFPISSHFGIWPRLGIGYTSHQFDNLNGNLYTRDSLTSFILDFDCGFIFRFGEGWFLKAAPQLAFAPGGTHSQTDPNGNTRSADASMFQFSGLTGIGVYLDL
jgi:hypothetical protein